MCSCSISGLAVVGLLTASFAASGANRGRRARPGNVAADLHGRHWSCDGKAHDIGMGPGGPMKSTAVIRNDLGGFFQTGTIKGTIPNQPPFEGRSTPPTIPA